MDPPGQTVGVGSELILQVPKQMSIEAGHWALPDLPHKSKRPLEIKKEGASSHIKDAKYPQGSSPESI